MDLSEYKSFLDQEMFTILGQMDIASEIYDYLYLVSFHSSVLLSYSQAPNKRGPNKQEVGKITK